MSTRPLTGERGPFRAEHLREGDRYELSNGHAIYCNPAGREHAGRNLTGAAVLDSDPAVQWAGVDAGFTPEPGTMRAPDVAIAAPGTETGFIPGAPPLAVEYAGPGHDEADLKVKLAELLNNGTRQVWVVYLIGPRRVEVHTPDAPPRRYGPGEVLTAPGILKNPVPVEALYDREAGHRAVLRNLLQRAGYDGIEAIRAEGLEQGVKEGVEKGLKKGEKQGLEKGVQQGLEKGLEKGLEQGRVQQARTLVRQLQRRLGALSAADEAQIAALSMTRLEALALDLLDFTSAADLAHWLAQEVAD